MGAREGEHPFGDAGQLIALAAFLTVWIADSFFLRASTFLSEYVPLYLRLPASGLCLATAVLLAKSGHRVVPHGRRPEGLAMTGAFRSVRHPLYLGSLLAYVGMTVSTASVFSLMLLGGVFVFYNYIASCEETLLETRFGEEYRRYRRRTGKWVPRSSGVFAHRETEG
jgi:protein-S-isoprenylcysteine O-methyltransferase Ste14